jgi:hypothetical protein
MALHEWMGRGLAGLSAVGLTRVSPGLLSSWRKRLKRPGSATPGLAGRDDHRVRLGAGRRGAPP